MLLTSVKGSIWTWWGWSYSWSWSCCTLLLCSLNTRRSNLNFTPTAGQPIRIELPRWRICTNQSRAFTEGEELSLHDKRRDLRHTQRLYKESTVQKLERKSKKTKKKEKSVWIDKEVIDGSFQLYIKCYSMLCFCSSSATKTGSPILILIYILQLLLLYV